MKELEEILNELDVKVTRRGFLRLVAGGIGTGLLILALSQLLGPVLFVQNNRNPEEEFKYRACYSELQNILKALQNPIRAGHERIVPISELSSLAEVVTYSEIAWKYANCRVIDLGRFKIVSNAGKKAVFDVTDYTTGEKKAFSAMAAFSVLYNLYLVVNNIKKIGSINGYCKEYALGRVRKELCIASNAYLIALTKDIFKYSYPHVILEEGIAFWLSKAREYNGEIDDKINSFLSLIKRIPPEDPCINYAEMVRRDFGEEIKIYTMYSFNPSLDISKLAALVASEYYEEALEEIDPSVYLIATLSSDPRKYIIAKNIIPDYTHLKELGLSIVKEFVQNLLQVVRTFK